MVLSVKDTARSPTLTGKPRKFTITNTGTAPALAVIYAVATGSPALPTDTTTLSNCTTLAPGASCTITVTPGATPSSARGDRTPVPVTLSVGGSNTNLLSPTVQVVGYANVYQGGYVFAIDDTTPDTGSVGGKVASLDDAGGAPAPTKPWSTTNDVVASTSLTDGQANTAAILAQYTGSELPSNYAAGLCSTSSNGGVSGWYLPAICEMGHDEAAAGTGCGSAASPLVENMQSNLVADGTLTGLPPRYWSSTQSSMTNAWQQEFAIGLASGTQTPGAKAGDLTPVRCARALTY
ncbi:MAG: hypothetical protein KIT86_04070 [Hydrogenophaga sp.]|nr:hypothetical protein [Hydrogenophaga sp.]